MIQFLLMLQKSQLPTMDSFFQINIYNSIFYQMQLITENNN